MKDKISSVSDLLSDASFKRWAGGTASHQEALAWDRWCRESEFNRRLAIKAQSELFKITPVVSHQINSEKTWKVLHERIKKPEMDRFANRHKKQPVLWWYRAAAVLLVAAMVGFITYEVHTPDAAQPEQKEEVIWKNITTSYGEQKTIALSDGSSIILNANSSLRYPSAWIQGQSIEVQLEGEAYFDIDKRTSPDQPAFNVETFDGTVQVMGTRFAVETEEEQKTRVVLEEGAVRIVKKSSEKDQKDFIQLRPDELAEFSRFDESVVIKKVNTQIFTSWTRQVLVLDNTPFGYLSDRIRKTYGVEVRIKDPELLERRLTGSVNFRSLDMLIQAISEVLEIDVRRSDNTVIFGSDFDA